MGQTVGKNKPKQQENNNNKVEEGGGGYDGYIFKKYQTCSKESFGEGKYGTVYKAVRIDNQQDFVALKVIYPSEGETEEQFIESAQNEIDLLTILEHENIVKLRATFRMEKDPIYGKAAYIIITELCECNLDEIFDNYQDKLDFQTILPLFVQLVRALEYMASKDIVHRDIKPTNVFINLKEKGYVVKLGDMGIAVRDDSGGKLNEIVGTPIYLSPEQFKGDYNSTCDLWAVGLIAFQLSAGYSTQNFINECKNNLPRNQNFSWSLLSPISKLHKIVYSRSNDLCIARLACKLLVPQNDRPDAKEILLNPIIKIWSLLNTYSKKTISSSIETILPTIRHSLKHTTKEIEFDDVACLLLSGIKDNQYQDLFLTLLTYITNNSAKFSILIAANSITPLVTLIAKFTSSSRVILNQVNSNNSNNNNTNNSNNNNSNNSNNGYNSYLSYTEVNSKEILENLDPIIGRLEMTCTCLYRFLRILKASEKRSLYMNAERSLLFYGRIFLFFELLVSDDFPVRLIFLKLLYFVIKNNISLSRNFFQIQGSQMKILELYQKAENIKLKTITSKLYSHIIIHQTNHWERKPKYIYKVIDKCPIITYRHLNLIHPKLFSDPLLVNSIPFLKSKTNSLTKSFYQISRSHLNNNKNDQNNNKKINLNPKIVIPKIEQKLIRILTIYRTILEDINNEAKRLSLMGLCFHSLQSSLPLPYHNNQNNNKNINKNDINNILNINNKNKNNNNDNDDEEDEKKKGEEKKIESKWSFVNEDLFYCLTCNEEDDFTDLFHYKNSLSQSFLQSKNNQSNELDDQSNDQTNEEMDQKIYVCSTCAGRCHKKHKLLFIPFSNQRCTCRQRGNCRSQFKLPKYPADIGEYLPIDHCNLNIDLECYRFVSADMKNPTVTRLQTDELDEKMGSANHYCIFSFSPFYVPLTDSAATTNHVEFYFELKIEYQHFSDEISLGFSTEKSFDFLPPLHLMQNNYKCDFNAGFLNNSVGYRSDSGECWVTDNQSKRKYLETFPKFGVGDVIGCGILPYSMFFFTKNGRLLYPIISLSSIEQFKPSVGQHYYPYIYLKSQSEFQPQIELNFGLEQFCFSFNPQQINQSQRLIKNTCKPIFDFAMKNFSSPLVRAHLNYLYRLCDFPLPDLDDDEDNANNNNNKQSTDNNNNIQSKKEENNNEENINNNKNENEKEVKEEEEKPIFLMPTKISEIKTDDALQDLVNSMSFDDYDIDDY